ncbi:MAG: hypothetical protein ACYTKD_06995 [Planctomycetota bacterium]
MKESHENESLPTGWPIGGFACLRGVALIVDEMERPWIEYGRDYPGRTFLVHEPDNMRSHVWVHCGYMDPTGIDGQAELRGRVHYGPNPLPGYGFHASDPVTVDMTASRFHPASVAGIVVGAMGVFVFGLYLRRWVKERRAA